MFYGQKTEIGMEEWPDFGIFIYARYFYRARQIFYAVKSTSEMLETSFILFGTSPRQITTLQNVIVLA